MSYRLTILGCGSSGGVPRLGNDWGKCNPANPRNRRRRCAVLVERREHGRVTSVLVDTAPDLREQLLELGIQSLDGVLYTHDHADHVHGIDDLRALAYRMKRRIPAWFDAQTRASIETRFGYCFTATQGGLYPPILTANDLHPPAPVRIAGPAGAVEAVPVVQDHGPFVSLGFRFGHIAYSPDISGVPAVSQALLTGLDVWIVDALRYTPHPSHFTVKQALQWIDRLECKRAILTHLHVDLDYDALKRELPP